MRHLSNWDTYWREVFIPVWHIIGVRYLLQQGNLLLGGGGGAFIADRHLLEKGIYCRQAFIRVRYLLQTGIY